MEVAEGTEVKRWKEGKEGQARKSSKYKRAV